MYYVNQKQLQDRNHKRKFVRAWSNGITEIPNQQRCRSGNLPSFTAFIHQVGLDHQKRDFIYLIAGLRTRFKGNWASEGRLASDRQFTSVPVSRLKTTAETLWPFFPSLLKQKLLVFFYSCKGFTILASDIKSF
jgi:hypothetical protein